MHLKTLGLLKHNEAEWRVVLHVEFVAEYEALPEAVQDELLASTVNLREKGPLLGRPLVDTLNGSRHAHMKELRFRAEGGGLPLRSTQSGRRFCLLRETRQEFRNDDSTVT
ncbi:MAG: type II toxin-antitoxin system RelE/ParE family toxin [Terracidiphilus sp.]|jgi:hypothetical protein